jgi:hypothetical protein
MVAGEILAGIAGLGNDLAADFKCAHRFQDDRRLRRLAILLSEGGSTQCGKQQCRGERLPPFRAAVHPFIAGTTYQIHHNSLPNACRFSRSQRVSC